MRNKEYKKIHRAIKSKKHLGQNFLKSALALRKITEAGEITSEDVVLEIGPGKGILTEKLLGKVHSVQKRAGQGIVIAVEKDRELFEMLSEKFVKEIQMRTLVLVCEDILKFDIQNFTGKKFSQVLGSPLGDPRGAQPNHSKTSHLLRYKIVANIPYNITGAILKKFLTAKNQPERMILMLQHEVAKRILATDGKESILSISVKAYGEPKMVMKVPARYFSPAPKVDSAIISIKNISRSIFEENNLNEDKFWQIVKAGFAHKRKKLSGNLKNICSKESLAPFGDKRAENLTLEDWINLGR
jgi:16S rRNA (adenine1518-N6/adenine1519-N6)-dimethyltransferase